MPAKVKKAKKTKKTPVAVGLNDTIGHNRACPVIPAHSIPAVPHGYRPTDMVQRRRQLRVVAGDLRAEALKALEQVAHNAATTEHDFGEFAPPASDAKSVVTRFTAIRASRAALEALLAYHDEIEDIATNDIVLLLEAYNKEYQHRLSRMPQLAQRYPDLVTFFDARSAAIIEGIARTKAPAPAETPPANTNTTPAEATGK